MRIAMLFRKLWLLIFWNSLCHVKIFLRVEIVKYYMGEKEARESVAALACRLGLRHS